MARGAAAAALLLLLTCTASALPPPPKLMGAGTEARQWLPKRAPVENPSLRFPVVIQGGITVTTRDGIPLDARLFRPTLPAGAAPTPCVLMADGYGHASDTGIGTDRVLKDIASRGYAVLHLSLRGSGKSGGTATLYNRYGQDGYDAVEWMAKQAWCNGRVGMVGCVPARHRAVADGQGGAAEPAGDRAASRLRRLLRDGLVSRRHDARAGPRGAQAAAGRENRVWGGDRHRDLDGWWRERLTLAPDVAAIAGRGVAAFVAGGLDDYISPANLRAYEQFTSGRKRLLFAPHAHGWQIDVLGELQVQWLDHWLKDADNGIELRDADNGVGLKNADNGVGQASKVILFIKGIDRWRTEADWPIPDARMATLFLQAGPSQTIGSLNDGAMTAQPAAGPPATLPYVPGAGPALPVLLSATLGRPYGDQREAEERVLTWTTAPLPVATEVTGYPHVSLWAASTTTDGDMVFSLNDVAPDGKSTQVVQGYLNVPHQASLSDPAPLVPGEARRVELDLLPTAYVFQPGHRLRLALAGAASAAPGLPFPQGPGPNPAAFTWTVLQDADHPATLALPIVGTAGDQLSRLTVAQQ